MKLILLLLVLIVASIFFFVPQKATFKELVTNPQNYAGKDICTEGVYLQAFETLVLTESIEFEEGFPRIKGETIWVEGPNIKKDELKRGLTYLYGNVSICGRFETGSGFGHVGSYKHQFTMTKWETLLAFIKLMLFRPNTQEASEQLK